MFTPPILPSPLISINILVQNLAIKALISPEQRSRRRLRRTTKPLPSAHHAAISTSCTVDSHDHRGASYQHGRSDRNSQRRQWLIPPSFANPATAHGTRVFLSF